MNLRIQKRLAAQALKCSPQKIVFNTERLADIKESITKVDIKTLVKDYAIAKRSTKGPSRVRARINLVQKRKGRRAGYGSRKGKATARLPSKTQWVNKIRKLRATLMEMKTKKILTQAQYTDLYRKAKGGFFRSQRHMKLFINDTLKK